MWHEIVFIVYITPFLKPAGFFSEVEMCLNRNNSHFTWVKIECENVFCLQAVQKSCNFPFPVVDILLRRSRQRGPWGNQKGWWEPRCRMRFAEKISSVGFSKFIYVRSWLYYIINLYGLYLSNSKLKIKWGGGSWGRKCAKGGLWLKKFAGPCRTPILWFKYKAKTKVWYCICTKDWFNKKIHSKSDIPLKKTMRGLVNNILYVIKIECMRKNT